MPENPTLDPFEEKNLFCQAINVQKQKIGAKTAPPTDTSTAATPQHYNQLHSPARGKEQRRRLGPLRPPSAEKSEQPLGPAPIAQRERMGFQKD